MSSMALDVAVVERIGSRSFSSARPADLLDTNIVNCPSWLAAIVHGDLILTTLFGCHFERHGIGSVEACDRRYVAVDLVTCAVIDCVEVTTGRAADTSLGVESEAPLDGAP